MVDEKKPPPTYKLIPSTLKEKDIPNADSFFAYIVIQESKNNILGNKDWDMMAALFGNTVKPKTLKERFGPIRMAAKVNEIDAATACKRSYC